MAIPFSFLQSASAIVSPTVPSLPVRFDKLNYQSHMGTRHSEIGQMPLQGLVNMTNHDSGEHLVCRTFHRLPGSFPQFSEYHEVEHHRMAQNKLRNDSGNPRGQDLRTYSHLEHQLTCRQADSVPGAYGFSHLEVRNTNRTLCAAAADS